MEQTLPGFQLGSSWVLAIGLPTDVLKWSNSYIKNLSPERASRISKEPVSFPLLSELLTLFADRDSWMPRKGCFVKSTNLLLALRKLAVFIEGGVLMAESKIVEIIENSMKQRFLGL
jgi:hypothetical protein